MTRKAFTLIELLVVIAIIAILAAILFPVFLSARQKAKTTKCLAHGRQIGEACMMYFADNNDRFPSAIWSWPSSDAQGKAVAGSPRDQIEKYLSGFTWYYYWAKDSKGTWEKWTALGPIFNGQQTDCPEAQWRFVQLKRYVKNEDVWICPDPNAMYAKRYAYGFRISWCPQSVDWWNGSKYIGFVDGDHGFADKNGVGRTVAEVQDLDRRGDTDCGPRYMPPSKKVMWMCYALGAWANGGNVGDGSWPWIFPCYSHSDGSVFVYADGHAAWQRMGKGWAPINYTKLSVDQR